MALLILSGASLIFALPLPIRIACGFLQAFYIPGLVFLAFIGNRERTLLDEIFLPLLISPILISLLFLGIYGITSSFQTSLTLSTSVFYLLLLIALLKGLQHSTGVPLPVPNSIFLVSVPFCAVIAITYILNNYLLVYTDAWHHISVVNEILDRGIPPMEPRFPDVPIRYMWFYHLFQAIWKELSGLSTEVALGIFNIVNAFIFPYLVARLISFFTKDYRYIIASSVFACAGFESAGWILWPLKFARIFFGQVRGSEELARIVSQIKINDANVIYTLTAPATWLMNLHDKFITITAMNVTFNLFILCLIIVLANSKVKNLHIRAGITICLVVLGTLLYHAVVGTALVLTTLGSAILIVLAGRIQKGIKAPKFLFTIVPGFAILAAIFGMPYFLSLTVGGGEGSFLSKHLGIGYYSILTTMAPLVVLLPFSMRTFKKIFTSDTLEFRILATWIASLIVISLFTNLPGICENKVLFPLFLILFPFIACQIVDSLIRQRGIRRTLLYAWMLLLFLVPPVLTIRGFILDKPKTPRYEKRFYLSKSEREIFDWIRNNTDINAVIIEKNTHNLMPVHARRRNFYLMPTFIYVHDYGGEKVERYGAIYEELFSDAPVEVKTIEYLRSKEMDFYIVIWQYDLATSPFLNAKFLSNPEWFEKTYENASGAIYVLKK